MQHTFGVFYYRHDGMYTKDKAVKVYKREYDAITYIMRQPCHMVVRRMGLLGK